MSLLQPSTDHDVFEIYVGSDSVGLVWRRDSIWFADPDDMSNAAISAEDRKGAVEALVRHTTASDTADQNR